ncbi:hypothetical protein [Micromonospora sp. CPCC 206061]|uniref:hypothetical protein n=1 Tax=Micromonospora sp. CPCC 206061 TaxID=3122410 RepID=UPI002FF2284E
MPTSDGGGPTTRLAVDGFVGAAGTYYRFGPLRVMDTREGRGVRKGVLGRQGTVSLRLAGPDALLREGVAAVVLNVTVTGATNDSYLTVYPAGGQRPTASSLNYAKGWTGANLVTVPISADGVVTFYNHSGSVHVIADLVGYYAGDNSVLSIVGPGNELVRTTPERLVDTRRDGIGAVPSDSNITFLWM